MKTALGVFEELHGYLVTVPTGTATDLAAPQGATMSQVCSLTGPADTTVRQHRDIATGLHSLGALYLEAGNHAAALSPLLRCASILEVTDGVGEALAGVLTALAEQQKVVGEKLTAAALYRRVLSILYCSPARPPPRACAVAVAGLAEMLRTEGRDKQAMLLLQHGLELHREADSSEAPAGSFPTACVLLQLAELWEGAGEYSRAEKLFQESLHIFRQHLGSIHSESARAMEGIARSLAKLRRSADASVVAQGAMAVRQAGNRQSRPEDVEACRIAAESLRFEWTGYGSVEVPAGQQPASLGPQECSRERPWRGTMRAAPESSAASPDSAGATSPQSAPHGDASPLMETQAMMRHRREAQRLREEFQKLRAEGCERVKELEQQLAKADSTIQRLGV